MHDYAYDCLSNDRANDRACNLIFGPVLPHYSATFCTNCYPSIVTAGSGGGPQKTGERDLILDYLDNVQTRSWSENIFKSCKVRGTIAPNVAYCEGKEKLAAIRGVIQWYKHQGIDIEDSKVYLFDDKKDNIEPLSGSGINAHQVSCDTRDDNIGLCGATVREISEDKGVTFCDEHFSHF